MVFFYLYDIFQKKQKLANQSFHFNYYQVDSLAISTLEMTGSFEKKFLILMPSEDQEESNLTLLQNILSAINLEFPKDIKVGYLESDQTYQLLSFLQKHQPSTILTFGLPPKHLSLNITSRPYDIIQIHDCQWIFADSLTQISKDKLLKKRLWEALKRLN